MKARTSIDFYHWAVLILTIAALAGPVTFAVVMLVVGLFVLLYRCFPRNDHKDFFSHHANKRLYGGILFFVFCLTAGRYLMGY